MLKKGQSLIEFVLVIGLSIVLLFGIIEISLFWRNVQTVQQIAHEAGIIASGGSIPYGGGANTAVDQAAVYVAGRVKSLGIGSLTLSKAVIASAGTQPFSAYRFTGGTAPDGGTLITLVIDYRNPVSKGVITQLTYRYRTILGGVGFQIPGGKSIVIIPRDIPISSSKIQEYNTY